MRRVRRATRLRSAPSKEEGPSVRAPGEHLVEERGFGERGEAPRNLACVERDDLENPGLVRGSSRPIARNRPYARGREAGGRRGGSVSLCRFPRSRATIHSAQFRNRSSSRRETRRSPRGTSASALHDRTDVARLGVDSIAGPAAALVPARWPGRSAHPEIQRSRDNRRHPRVQLALLACLERQDGKRQYLLESPPGTGFVTKDEKFAVRRPIGPSVGSDEPRWPATAGAVTFPVSGSSRRRRRLLIVVWTP
jgi:hypothetical protein